MSIVLKLEKKSWQTILLTLVLVGGGFLRFFKIGSQSFWDDEVATFTVARLPLKVIWNIIGNIDFNPPFYYFLLHFWMQIAEGEFIYRALSALLGLTAIMLTYLLGRRIIGKWGAFLGAALYGVSPLTVYCSQETRYNMLLTCLGLASIYFFLRLNESGRWRFVFGFAICLIMMIYTHYYSFFIVAALVAYMMFLGIRTSFFSKKSAPALGWLASVSVLSKNENVRWPAGVLFAAIPIGVKAVVGNLTKAFIGLVIAFVAFIPFMKYFLVQVVRGMPGRELTPVSQVVKKVFAYIFVGHSPTYLPTLANPLERLVSVHPNWHLWILILLSAPIFALIVYGLFSEKNRYPVFLGTMILVPFSLVVLVSFKMPVFDPRYLAPFIPAVCIAAGAGCARLFGKRKLLAVALILYVLLLSALSLKDYYFKPRFSRQDWRSTAQMISENTEKGDAVGFYNYYTSLAFNYYYKGDAPLLFFYEFEQRWVPLDKRREKLAKNLDTFSRNFDRIWLIDYHGSHDDPYDDVRKGLSGEGYIKVLRKCNMTGLFRFCVEKYSKIAADETSGYLNAIDFGTDQINDLQLEQGFHPGDGPWRWIGKTARVAFVEPSTPYRVAVTFYTNYRYLGSKPFFVDIFAGKKQIGKIRVDGSAVFNLVSEIIEPANPTDKLIIKIVSDKAFVPHQILNDGDFSTKSLLIKSIEISRVEPEETGDEE